jgi:hypothetical protein
VSEMAQESSQERTQLTLPLRQIRPTPRFGREGFAHVALNDGRLLELYPTTAGIGATLYFKEGSDPASRKASSPTLRGVIAKLLNVPSYSGTVDHIVAYLETKALA